MDSILKPIFEKTLKGPILYIRHGQTDYNLISRNTPKEKTRVMKEYLDCPLNKEGLQQSEEISKIIQEFKIKYVFCSPLLRCLETSLLSLKNHPDKNNFKIMVHPYLNEIVSGVADFSRNIKMKKKMFNLDSDLKYDWKCFDDLFVDESSQECYFLDFIDPKLVNESTENIIKKLKSQQYNKEEVDELLKEFAFNYTQIKQRPETLHYMFKRNLKFKEFLKKFCKSLEDDEKILVFTHSAFIKISTSKMAYEMEEIIDFPEDCYKLDNCEIITMNI